MNINNSTNDQKKIVYDGKRIQPIYERKMVDYSSSFIYQKYLKSPIIPYNRASAYIKNFDFSSQVISLNSPYDISKYSSPYKQYPIKFMQMCINKQRSPINTLTWSPDGRRLLSGSSSGEITMWNGSFFNFDTILQAHTFPIKKIQFSRNSSSSCSKSSLLLTGDNQGTLKYWNSSMSNLNIIENLHSQAIKDISFSYNDNIFLTASDDSTIKIVDTNSSRVISTLKGHNWDIRKAMFHPEYSLIASGGKDNLLKLWDPRESKCLGTFHSHKNSILSMDISHDYLITGGKDQVIKQFSFRTMKECFMYKTNSDVTSLEFMASKSNKISNGGGGGPLSFISGNSIGEILFWENFKDVHCEKTLKSHDNTVWCLEMHPMGHLLASGSSDFQIKFWCRLRHPGGADEEDATSEDKMSTVATTIGDDPYTKQTSTDGDFHIPGLS